MSRTAAVMLALALATPAAAAEPTYRAQSSTTLPSTDTGWDYITLESQGPRLFIARRNDGLTVFDTQANTVIATVDDSRGANGVVLVPEFNRGYTAMTDGTVLIFDLKTLARIDRIRADAGDLNQGFYEPTTKRVHMIVGPRPDRTTWITLDAATGRILGRTEFDSKKMDTPAVDGQGAIYAPMRDRNVLLKLDAQDLAIQATWTLGACTQPVPVEYDHAGRRVLIACRGDKPVFVALDPMDGRIAATLPIGRGVDGLAHDEATHTLITANGADATMSVIRQDTPDTYHLVETIMTRPMARVLAIEAQGQRLFTVTASHTQAAPGPDGRAPPPSFHPDSFTVMSYVRP